MEGIHELTGVWVPAERIRQFVKGVPKKDGTRKFPIPEPERLEALYRFVTDPDGGILSEEEIVGRDISQQAADRLLEFLRQDLDQELLIPPETIAGTFSYSKEGRSGMVASQLVLEPPQKNGIIRAYLVERFYDNDVNRENLYRYAAKIGLPKNQRHEVRYSGWGIFTPEDNLLIFLKEDRSGKNRYYLALSTDIVHSGLGNLDTFTLLHHHFPHEIADGEPKKERVVKSYVLDLLGQNLQFFARSIKKEKADDKK